MYWQISIEPLSLVLWASTARVEGRFCLHHNTALTIYITVNGDHSLKGKTAEMYLGTRKSGNSIFPLVPTMLDKYLLLSTEFHLSWRYFHPGFCTLINLSYDGILDYKWSYEMMLWIIYRIIGYKWSYKNILTCQSQLHYVSPFEMTTEYVFDWTPWSPLQQWFS